MPWVSDLQPRKNRGWFSPFRDSVSFCNTVDRRSPWWYIFTGRAITVRSSGSALFCVWALSSWSWCLSNGQQETAAAWAKGPGGKALVIRGPWCARQCHTDVMESYRPSASLPTTAVLHVPEHWSVARILGFFPAREQKQSQLTVYYKLDNKLSDWEVSSVISLRQPCKLANCE